MCSIIVESFVLVTYLCFKIYFLNNHQNSKNFLVLSKKAEFPAGCACVCDPRSIVTRG